MKYEMDEWLKQKLDEDLMAMADERERFLMEAEELQGIEMPMEKLQDIYQMAEEERQKEQNTKVRRIPHLRPAMIVAAVLVLCIGMGLVSSGKKVYIPEIFQRKHGDEIETKIENTDSIYSHYDEGEVNQEIEEKLGVIPVRFGYQPDGMYLANYSIDETNKEVLIEYVYKGDILYIYISKDYNQSSINFQSDGEILDDFTIGSNGIDVEVYKYEDTKNQNYYISSFEYLNTYYYISGMMEQSEYIKILENISINNA